MGEEKFSNLKKAIIDGDEIISEELTVAALAEGIPANDILQKGLVPGIREIGKLFGQGEVYLPELIVSGQAMETAIRHLEPFFAKESASNTGAFLIGTVQGDVHDIGKNIVAMMLKGNGWKVRDLGVDVSPEDFCKAVKEGAFDVLGMSALLTTTMASLDLTIEALNQAGLRHKIKIMIGGAPVTQDYADKIGANAFGLDAWDAITKAEKLLAAARQ
ncbi:MAG: corrinoid protein [Deltaproteobacteria bacterium]|nr:corrinoid protein [Deltaproteobacteria bacterium]MBW2084988.1 corrinoid protein [Deltaproteobacteria bacterium]